MHFCKTFHVIIFSLSFSSLNMETTLIFKKYPVVVILFLKMLKRKSGLQYYEKTIRGLALITYCWVSNMMPSGTAVSAADTPTLPLALSRPFHPTWFLYLRKLEISRVQTSNLLSFTPYIYLISTWAYFSKQKARAWNSSNLDLFISAQSSIFLKLK